MTLKDYQFNCTRTLPNLGIHKVESVKIVDGEEVVIKYHEANVNIAHMIFGMFSEYNELVEATDDVNRAEELSDINWYFQNYCTITNIDLWRINDWVNGGYFYILQNEDYITNLFVKISKLCDLEKKHMAYGKPVNHEDRLKLVDDIFMALNDCYSFFGIDVFDSTAKNIAKLQARYGEAFLDKSDWREKALNRNLNKERKILEG